MTLSLQVQCVGVLSKALGASWKGPAASLIEPMILTGLSSTLVQSLQVSRPLHDSAPRYAADK